jgi:DNA polymerase-3 subunit delta'
MPLGSIVGHAPVITLLRQAVVRERVPQSLLLAGPEGIGKWAVALALAQAINCPVRRARQGDDACGACPTCQRIERGQHSDVALVQRGDDSVIKLKTLREQVLDVVGYRPFEAHRRVFIIDADDLRFDAQDALLKTLEEPPASALLILVSAQPDALSATVQSRCRRLRFGPLGERDVERVLVDRLGLEPAVARGLAAASGGTVARALAEHAGDLGDDREAALAVLAATRRSVGDQLKASAALAKHDSDRRDREALAMRLDVLASLLRDLAAMSAGAPHVLANADLEPDLRKLAAGIDVPRALRGYAALARAQWALGRNASPKIVADWVSLQL